MNGRLNGRLKSRACGTGLKESLFFYNILN